MVERPNGKSSRRPEQARVRKLDREALRAARKPFVQINVGHQTEDIPMIPQLTTFVDGQMNILPANKKLLLYVEDFSGDPLLTQQTIDLITKQGMTLSEAQVQIEYDALPWRKKRAHKERETRNAIRLKQFQHADPYEQELTAAIDNILSQYPGRIVVQFEHQPPENIEANKRFYQELTSRFPVGTTDDEIVTKRYAQIERWGLSQRVREDNQVEQIVDGMSREDVGAGISVIGAWHFGGLDHRLRHELAPADDPHARNVIGVFPETGMVREIHGRVNYPVDPEIALMRRVMNGEPVTELEVLLAYEASQIDFRGRTAEQVILAEVEEASEEFFSNEVEAAYRARVAGLVDTEAPTVEIAPVDAEAITTEITIDAPTEVMSIIPPQVSGAREAAEQLKYMRLKLGLISKTLEIPAIEAAAKAQYEENMRKQAEGPHDSSVSELARTTSEVRVRLPRGRGDGEEDFSGAWTAGSHRTDIQRGTPPQVKIVGYHEVFDKDDASRGHDNGRD